MFYLASAFLAGSIFGAVIAVAAFYLVSKRNEKDFGAAVEAATTRLKESFADLSFDAMSKTTDHMIKIASEKLSSEREINVKEIAGHKQAIESRIGDLNGEIEKLKDLVSALENRRSAQMGELRSAIDSTRVQTKQLYDVTHNLHETLSSKQSRGQWGERMAEDILAGSGLKIGVNYLRQYSDTTTGNRPDFTFLLPNKMKLNMDVKFPFENYQRYLESSETEKPRFRQAFVRDVKNHIKAVSGRDYINPADNTLDCVVMFIPNERIYGFIFECDPAVMDEAASKNVLICSPVTVISVLAVIRQAADNFVIERRARDLLQAVGVFRKEWLKYTESFDKLGYYIDKMAGEYRELSSVRSNKLDNSVSRLESMKKEDEIEYKLTDG